MTEQPNAPTQAATQQPETLAQLTTRLAGLVKLASDAVASGDTQALLDSAGEIAALKKSIETIQKAEKAAKLQVNQAEISMLLLTVTGNFDAAFKASKKEIQRLNELGHDVEVVRYAVDIASNEKTCQVGPKTKTRVSTGTGGNKSKRTVTLADGSTMDTRAFVDAYANEEERGSKTFTSWPTALAEKIAKRVGATISQ